jgi:hypothetical protein
MWLERERGTRACVDPRGPGCWWCQQSIDVTRASRMWPEGAHGHQRRCTPVSGVVSLDQARSQFLPTFCGKWENARQACMTHASKGCISQRHGSEHPRRRCRLLRSDKGEPDCHHRHVHLNFGRQCLQRSFNVLFYRLMTPRHCASQIVGPGRDRAM